MVSAETLRDAVASLVVAHGRHWGRDADDPAQVSALAAAATDLLVACDLARRAGAGGVRPRPLAARFRTPMLRTAGAHA